MKKIIIIALLAICLIFISPPVKCLSDDSMVDNIPMSMYNHSGKKAISPKEAMLVIDHVVDRLPHIDDKDNYKRLIHETASAETDFGEFKYRPKIKGMYQIHIQSAKEILDMCRKIYPEGYKAVMDFYDSDKSFSHNLHHNIMFGTAVCATYYKIKIPKRQAFDLSTVRKRGLQWLKIYATPSGGGSMAYWIKKSKHTEGLS